MHYLCSFEVSFSNTNSVIFLLPLSCFSASAINLAMDSIVVWPHCAWPHCVDGYTCNSQCQGLLGLKRGSWVHWGYPLTQYLPPQRLDGLFQPQGTNGEPVAFIFNCVYDSSSNFLRACSGYYLLVLISLGKLQDTLTISNQPCYGTYTTLTDSGIMNLPGLGSRLPSPSSVWRAPMAWGHELISLKDYVWPSILKHMSRSTCWN